MRIYAIGDVHGQFSKLETALALIEEDRAQARDQAAPLVQVGDLIDRGPESAATVARFIELTRADPRITVLLGNHDNMFLHFMRTPPQQDPRLRANLTWLNPRLGGQETLASYGVDIDAALPDIHAQAKALVPEEHLVFLASLPLTFAHDECLFVHAGIRPGVTIDQQDPEDLYWIRNEFLVDPTDHGPLIVHGHTPVDRVEHHGNRLAIDTGAAYGRALSAVVIEGRRVWLLTHAGRQEITPHAAA
jgi:diadenosine tetraphosphatase ApaH/serine/threonine PP2A family protein phosphatase